MITKSYLHPKNILKFRAAFHAFPELPSITLMDIFSPTIYRQVCREVQSLSYSHVQQPGLHSYRSASLSPALISQFNIPEFRRFLAAITQNNLPAIS